MISTARNRHGHAARLLYLLLRLCELCLEIAWLDGLAVVVLGSLGGPFEEPVIVR